MRKKLILGIIISGILIYFLLTLINPSDILNVLYEFPLLYLGISFLLYVFTMIFRTIRFNFILETKLKLRQLFNIIAIHNLMTNLIPMRLGEFSYVYLMKKKGVHVSKGLSQLLIVRVYDVMAISIIFIISTFFVKSVPVIVSYYVKLISIFLILLFLGFFIFLKFDKKLIKIFKKLNPVKKSTLIEKMFITLEDLSKNFKKSLKMQTALKLFCLSFILWIINYLMTYYLILGFGIPFNFWEVSLIFTFLIILIMLPISSFSGFGVWEGGLTGAFTAFGIGLEKAVATSFAFHIISILFFLIIGLFGLFGHYVFDK